MKAASAAGTDALPIRLFFYMSVIALVAIRGAPRRRVRARAALASVLLAYGSWACALDPLLDVSQYAHTAWSFHNGFLNGAVYTVAQGPDGYLWLGTQTGVYRFDGVRAFSPILRSGEPVANTEVGALLPAHDGSLWIGSLDGVVSVRNGELTPHPALGRRRVNVLLQDSAGTIWVGTAFGGAAGRLCAIRGETTRCYGDDGSLGAAVESLYEDADGSLWVGADSGLWRFRPGAPRQYSSVPIVDRQSLTQGDRGAGLTIAMGSSVRELRGSTVTDHPLPGTPAALNVTRVLRDRSGGLWIGTQARGLVHEYAGRTSVFTHADGLSSDQVKVLFEDREGNIWVGTSAGLDRFHDLAVKSLSTEQGLSSPFVNSVLSARDGSVWVGTLDGLDRLKSSQVTVFRKGDQRGLTDDEIESLFEDDHGRLWVSGFHGLAVLEGEKFRPVPAVPPGANFGMTADGHGGLWLSLWFTSKEDDGLLHLVEGQLAERIAWRKLGGGPGTGGLVADPQGRIWSGMGSGGVSYHDGGQYVSVPLGDTGHAAPKVLDLSRNPDGTFWIATESGLSRLANGRISTLTTANGLPCNQLHWFLADDASAYWLYARCGLLRIARQELDAWIADPKRSVHVTTFDAADGVRLVPVLSGFRPQVARSADGRIWFINYDAVSYFDPSRMVSNPLAPPVHIEQLIADRKAYPATSGLGLPPRLRDLTIEYTGLSLVSPEKMRFRYRLDGQDPEWREVLNERQAHYSNLGPGTYRFRVIASNNSGVWNSQGDSLEFSIAPAYWQTLWFRLSCGSAALGLILLFYRLRMRQLARAFKMKLDTRVDERTRIARDLHDTLLQNFQGVLLQFGAARRLVLREPDKAEKVLAAAIDQAVQAIREGRETVQELRTSALESNNLASAIMRLGKDLEGAMSADHVPSVQVEVEGATRDLHPIIRDEVFRVAAEALRNAFQHSRGTKIEVELRYDPREFRLRVRDDGQGIDPRILTAGAREGHFGLHGMRERAKLADGKLTVWSAPASGTEIELVIPGFKAYASIRSSRRLEGS
jgi:signal transduction histidine kinase/ligand-binding sensor domain-containing protein